MTNVYYMNNNLFTGNKSRIGDLHKDWVMFTDDDDGALLTMDQCALLWTDYMFMCEWTSLLLLQFLQEEGQVRAL